MALYETGIYEARLLTCRLYNPALITRAQMNRWAADFENWEICDSYCIGFFPNSPYAIEKAFQCLEKQQEFVKRAAFAVMAAYPMADKQADNYVFEQFLPLIEREAKDERHYVKKAVNWAFRSIGKRNIDLKILAIECAERVIQQNTKSAIWIAKYALAELHKPKVKIQDHPRSIYRPKL